MRLQGKRNSLRNELEPGTKIPGCFKYNKYNKYNKSHWHIPISSIAPRLDHVKGGDLYWSTCNTTLRVIWVIVNTDVESTATAKQMHSSVLVYIYIISRKQWCFSSSTSFHSNGSSVLIQILDLPDSTLKHSSRNYFASFSEHSAGSRLFRKRLAEVVIDKTSGSR